MNGKWCKRAASLNKILLVFLCSALLVCSVAGVAAEREQKSAPTADRTVKTALFAGGCFWCMEKPFEEKDGVLDVVSGYSGGNTENPTYKTYASGGHIEVVQIHFDPNLISYDELLSIFWRQIDPTDGGGQFVDRGHEYSSALFYYDDEQRTRAEASKASLKQSGIFSKPIVTPILPASKFWPAEEYHQDYYKKNTFRYTFYRAGSGRDSFLKRHWAGQDWGFSAQ